MCTFVSSFRKTNKKINSGNIRRVCKVTFDRLFSEAKLCYILKNDDKLKYLCVHLQGLYDDHFGIKEILSQLI